MTQPTKPARHWYNDRELFLHGLVRSNYVTAITDWFLSFAGKWAELVLYSTVLYSGAQLYPGVHLPTALSLAVFLIQLGALDIGGLSLAKLAKQAREDDNADGAQQAEILSRWLIGIMLTGVVTVGVEHVLPIPAQVQTGVEIVLVVARSICAVFYGRVVHALKQEPARSIVAVFDVTEQMSELSAELSQQVSETERRLTELVQRTVTELLAHLTERIDPTATEQSVMREMARLTETVQAHEQALAELAALPGLLDSQLRAAVQDLKTALTPSTEPKKPGALNTTRPKLTVVGANTEHLTPKRDRISRANTTEMEKGAFVRQCLTDTPTMRNVDMQRKAGEMGITISPSYISETRKAFLREQTAEQGGELGHQA